MNIYVAVGNNHLTDKIKQNFFGSDRTGVSVIRKLSTEATFLKNFVCVIVAGTEWYDFVSDIFQEKSHQKNSKSATRENT
jgi:predicted RNA-binding protein